MFQTNERDCNFNSNAQNTWNLLYILLVILKANTLRLNMCIARILSQSFEKVVCEREATVNKVYSIISADAYMIGFECRCFAAASRASCVFSL